MDENEIIDKLQDKILKMLPDEAVKELAEISEDTEDAELKIQAILKRNGIDAAALAKEMTEEKKENE